MRTNRWTWKWGRSTQGRAAPRPAEKPERFRRGLEDEIWNYPGLDDYIEYCDADRPRFSPDVNNCETPFMAFRNETATGETRRRNPDWMEADANG